MENKENNTEKDEIINPEQFQVGRGLHEDNNEDQAEEVSYTPEENQFADGKGTQLDEEMGDETEFDEELPDDLNGLSLEEDDQD